MPTLLIVTSSLYLYTKGFFFFAKQLRSEGTLSSAASLEETARLM
jgi:hypothetical protein